MKLSVTVGVGIGEVVLLHVGGVFDRLEYLPLPDGSVVEVMNIEPIGKIKSIK